MDGRTRWQIDPDASRVTFTIRKRLFFLWGLTVTGRLSAVQGTIELDDRQPTTARASVSIEVASMDTRQARRDAHLRSDTFFDVARYPTIRFESRRIEPVDAVSGLYRVTGDLTIRDLTREVQLDTRYSSPMWEADAPRLTLTLSTSLNRYDFGLAWSNPLIRIDDDLTVAIEVQAVKRG
jgi:polyisoprenoid-binding protein YceI